MPPNMGLVALFPMPARGATADTKDNHPLGSPKGNTSTAPLRSRATSDCVVKVLNYNVWSLKAHLVEVRHVAEEWLKRGVDIFVLTETWLRPDEQTPRINGYVAAVRKDRSSSWGTNLGRGGGVLIYMRDKMGYAVEGITSTSGDIHEGIDVVRVNIVRGRKR